MMERALTRKRQNTLCETFPHGNSGKSSGSGDLPAAAASLRHFVQRNK
jgi:hypothetical protein